MLADLIFEPLTRVIRVKDLSTAEFLLPYLVLHILLGSRSRDVEKEQVIGELAGILEQQPLQDSSYAQREDMKRYFHVSIATATSVHNLTMIGCFQSARLRSTVDSRQTIRGAAVIGREGKGLAHSKYTG
jgi:hypothetical protein